MKYTKWIFAAVSLLATTVHAHAELATIGNLIIAAAIATGTAGLLPVASAAAIGGLVMGKMLRRRK